MFDLFLPLDEPPQKAVIPHVQDYQPDDLERLIKLRTLSGPDRTDLEIHGIAGRFTAIRQSHISEL